MITEYQVDGMTCGHCVNAVTNEVGAVPGVSSVRVDLATGVVTVASAEPLDYAAIGEAVDEAGYRLVAQR